MVTYKRKRFGEGVWKASLNTDSLVEEQGNQPPVTSGEMILAVDANDTGKIIFLVGNGESPSSIDGEGHTIVMRALAKGKLEAANVLFCCGADMLRVSLRGSNVLHYAARGGYLECIAWVFAKTTLDVNSVSHIGWTPVMHALWNGKKRAAKALFKRGADLSRLSYRGWNTLHIAAEGGDQECVKWVLAKTSINVNSTANRGRTAIGCALNNNKSRVGKLLVEKGANLFLKDLDGEMAIDIRVHNRPNGERWGPQVLLHAKDIRWSAAKECVLLSNACESPDRRKVANLSMDNDVDDAEIIKRSARLAASVVGDKGLSRLIASFIMRTDIIVRNKSAPLEKDDVKKRIEASLLKASSSGGGGKRARLE
jgi:ankyrin repeat protein